MAWLMVVRKDIRWTKLLLKNPKQYYQCCYFNPNENMHIRPFTKNTQWAAKRRKEKDVTEHRKCEKGV